MKTILLASIVQLTSCSESKTVEAQTPKSDVTINHLTQDIHKEKKPYVISKQDSSVVYKKETNTELQVQKKFFQESVEVAIDETWVIKKIDPLLLKVKKTLLDKDIPKQDKIYWLAYLHYYEAIFYKTIAKNDHKASASIEKAIELLNENPRTSEDYALLAGCTSFSIQFANLVQLPKISSKVSELAKKSLQLNPKNMRAYYVLASHNLYTPKMFGGVVKVEEYAHKGLACPERLDHKLYSPYWGKYKIYEILEDYYQMENRPLEAKKYKELIKKKL
ncbi:hypothetical protein GNY06_01950 [Elizabethkingia argentiflava]|uniref:Uncharacterized protein n=1 Tax=Elizabethkingia argenteiflava TaxID=2681556 RepID=A0A845PPD8_9FLAO|nr:hypothetical protein [Elizabethkingia argenteiflava]NAW50199.1 hypothetical protein [Elizabethkingia argenteiflava]